MRLLGSILDRHLIGLDIGISSIKAVELARGRSTRLVAYNRVPLPWNAVSPDGEIKQRDAVIESLRKLFSHRDFSTKRVAVGAFGNSIITKKISIAKMTRQELVEQLYWEAEQYIPFDVNEVNLDFAILGDSSSAGASPTMDVLLVAAKKDFIKGLTAVVSEAGLTPEIIDIQSFALGNSFEFNYSHILGAGAQEAMNVLVDFGAGSTKVSVIEGDKTTFSRELRQCGMSCTLMLSERLGVTFEEAERIKVEEPENTTAQAIIGEFNALLVDEIARTIDFCLGQSSDRSLQGIYICGGGCRTVGLADELEARLPAQIHLLNPVQNISGSGKKMSVGAIREIAFLGAVSIGLALRKAGDSA